MPSSSRVLLQSGRVQDAAVRGALTELVRQVNAALDDLEVAGVTPATHVHDGADVTTGTVADARIDAALARLASPALTGAPTAPTPTAGDNDTSIATTAFVNTIFVAPPALGSTTPAAVTGTILTPSTDPGGTPAAHGLYRANVPKAWIRFNMATDAIADSFNVSSITDGAAGQDTIVFDRDFSSASFAAVGSANYVGLDRAVWTLASFAAGSVLAVANRYASRAEEDATEFNAAFFGDQ